MANSLSLLVTAKGLLFLALLVLLASVALAPLALLAPLEAPSVAEEGETEIGEKKSIVQRPQSKSRFLSVT